MLRRTYHFSGRVQGVGFRYTALHIAQERPVSGFVRNLDDGRVEMTVEGEAADLDDLMGVLSERMEGNITRVDFNAAPATGEFTGFFIRH